MALSKDVVIRLLGDASSAQKAIKSAADAAEVSVGAYRRAEREADKQSKAMAAAAARQREAYDQLGRGMMTAGVVIAAGLGLSMKAAIDWETAWAGVKKTVDGSPEQMAALERELRNLATTLPVTHEEIAGVAEAAGQLGIARGDIVEFTKVAVAMGVSTNLSAEEAATGLAQMMNVMRTAPADVERLGSTLVALGNAGASTEADILAMAQRLAGAGELIGASEANVLALASSMADMGIQAELGGGAMSRVMLKIYSAMQDGGKAAEGFARVAGVSASEFAAKWRSSPVEAIDLFIQGLGRVKGEGGNVVQTLSDLGISGTQNLQVMLSLAGAGDQLTAALALSNEAWAENDALMNEANQRYETTASKLQMARNQITDAAIDIGAVLLPALAKGAEMIADFARGFQELPGWMQDSIVVIGTLAASVGLLGGAALIAGPKIAAFRVMMQTLADSSGAARAGVGKFGLFMAGPWGAAIGAATIGLGALVTWLGNSSRASEEAAAYQRTLADALRESGGVIDETVRALASAAAAGENDWGYDFLETADQLGLSLPKVTDAMLGQRGAFDELAAGADAYLQRALELANFNTEDPGFVAASEKVSTFKDRLEDAAGAMGGAVAENKRLAEATGESGGAAETTASTMDSLAQAQDNVAGTGADAATAAEDLADAIDALNGPTLNLRDATRGYEESLDKAQERIQGARDGLEGYAFTLDTTTEAGRANAEALDNIATSAMEQANAIAANGGSYDAFRGSLEASRQALVNTAMAMGMTEQDAWALADSILQIPDAATVDVRIPTYGQVEQQLRDVRAKVEGIPPGKVVNVGVLSQAAIDALTAVGIKVERLPDGTVNVTTAGTGAVEQALAWAARTRYATIVATTVTGASSANAAERRIPPRAEGGPVWPDQTFLVGERGPELVRFGQSGYVTPAQQTAQIRDALHQPRAGAPALAMAAAGASAGYASSTSYSRTYAPTIVVPSARPMSERQLVALLADEEFLHG